MRGESCDIDMLRLEREITEEYDDRCGGGLCVNLMERFNGVAERRGRENRQVEREREDRCAGIKGRGEREAGDGTRVHGERLGENKGGDTGVGENKKNWFGERRNRMIFFEKEAGESRVSHEEREDDRGVSLRSVMDYLRKSRSS